jgi:hypothetical protein
MAKVVESLSSKHESLSSKIVFGGPQYHQKMFPCHTVLSFLGVRGMAQVVRVPA